MVHIRPVEANDTEALRKLLWPVIRAGETYALPADMSQTDAVAWWFAEGHEVFVAESGEEIVGIYFLRGNYAG